MRDPLYNPLLGWNSKLVLWLKYAGKKHPLHCKPDYAIYKHTYIRFLKAKLPSKITLATRTYGKGHNAI